MFGYKNDLRRPSVVVATAFDQESPNGADIPHYNEQVHVGGGGGSSLNLSKVTGESIDLIVIGDETSNKTRFISCFLNNGIGEDPQLLDISCRKPVSIQSGTFNVNMHTTAGQEDFWGVNDSSFRSGHGFIFVYNVNSKESFNQFKKLREKIVYDKNTENIIMAIIGYVGNTDFTDEGGSADSDEGSVGATREVQFSEAKHMADLHSCSFTEFLNFDKESEGLINATIHDIVGRITNLNNSRGRSNSVSRGDSGGSSGSHADQSVNRLDLLLVGDIFTGKTQYIQRLIGNNFSQYYRETSLEFTPSLLQTNYKDNRYFLKLLDTRGIDLESNLIREKVNNIPGFIFVYSITSKMSFQQLEVLKRQVLSSKGETKVPCILIGTKSDALERQITLEEGQKLAQSWGCPHFEISSINHDDDIMIKPIHQLLGEIQKSNNSMDIGDFKKKGFLMKEGKKLKSMSKYYFKLHKGNLYFCKNEFTNQSLKNNTKIKMVELSEQIQVQIVHSDKKDIWPFQIIDPIKQYYMNLLAPSETERDGWVTTLKLNCYANEMIGILVDDVVKSIISEIAEQSLSIQIKRSDSKNNLLSNSSNSTPSHSSSPSTPQSPSPLFSSANGNHHNHNNSSSSNSSSSNNDSDYNSNSSPMLSGESASPFKKQNLLTRTSSFKGKQTVFK